MGGGVISLALSSFIALNADELTRDELHKDLKVEFPQPTFILPEDGIIHSFSFLGKNEKSYIGFKEKMGYRESRGNYFIVNNYGYMGKYQFGKTALDFYGVEDSEEFLTKPELQEKLFKISISYNKWQLQDEIEKYAGKRIGGVLVTESGILAAAHLAGAKNVKKYFATNGRNSFTDANGTTIRNYMKSFQGYDLSLIEADRKNKIE